MSQLTLKESQSDLSLKNDAEDQSSVSDPKSRDGGNIAVLLFLYFLQGETNDQRLNMQNFVVFNFS